jgi:cytidylate kinase
MSQPANVRHRPVVTIAALYGASGTVIGPRVAEQLGVPLLDREIPEALAQQTGLSLEAVASVDEKPRSLRHRLIDALGRASATSGTTGESGERLDLQEHVLRARIEAFLAESAASGGVAIGRGGMVVLRRVPWALHVHLGGPREARVAVRMDQDGIDRRVAEGRLRDEDRSRRAYVRRAYGIDGGDPRYYHLMLDTTALDLDTCVDIIVTAAQARLRRPTTAASS